MKTQLHNDTQKYNSREVRFFENLGHYSALLDEKWLFLIFQHEYIAVSEGRTF